MYSTGEVLFVPYRSMLLLRADVPHAGGFIVGDKGDPRKHLFVYRYPRGIVCALRQENWYFTPDGKVHLSKVCIHSDDIHEETMVDEGKNDNDLQFHF